MPAHVRDNKIAVTFRYDQEIIDRIKSLGIGAKWNPKEGHWTIPASPWHAKTLIDNLREKIVMGMDVIQLANQPNVNRLEGTERPLLYPFQNAGVDFLHAMKGRAMICDEPGLGKTVQALVYLKERYIRSALVVCPASVVLKWVDEINKWTDYSSLAILSSKSTVGSAYIQVMSYDMLSRLIDQYDRWTFEYLILDEFHKVKNHKALRTKAAKKVAKKASHVIGLSGTPLINKPIELWNALNMVNPKAWSNWYLYANRYCKNPETEMMDGAENLEELAERLETIMIRRKKRDVLDQLPPLTRTKIPVINIVGKSYNGIMNEKPEAIQSMYPDKEYFTNPLEKITALRRVLGYGKINAAVSLVEDILNTTEDKVVMYFTHLDVLEEVKHELRAWAITSITGMLTSEKRQHRINLWQTNPQYRVMMLTSAGGEGIDLFSKCERECSRIIFVEREWTSTAEEQAEARLDRIGQTSPVEAIYLVVQDTIDKDMDELIDQKRDLISTIVGGEKVPTVQSDLVSLLTSDN